MNFIDISTLNISTELDVLKRDTQRYSMLLYQHIGDFFADNTRIGNDNQSIAHEKFLKLIEKARQNNTALVLSPEYSCPKSVVEYTISNKSFQPANNKLWVFGGESINKEEIKHLLDYNSDDTFIHCEDVFSYSDKSYLDPLFYIFQGVYCGIAKLIILVQFKTRHMGVWSSDIERNNLIEGNSIYIIKNNNTSIRLISFICSEAMNVRDELTQQIKDDILWNDMPFLILHPQINPDPSHIHFVDFRRFILEAEKKEIVSLNWGVNTLFNGHNWYSDRVNTARSGIFFKTDELNYEKSRIAKNHNMGFYFLHINRNRYVYFLNGVPELFQIENPPVNIKEGKTPQRRREGPELIKLFKFDNASLNFQEIRFIDDKHINFFTNIGIKNKFLLNPSNSFLEKETLISLSTGKVNGKLENKWCEVIYLNSFNLKEADECNCRMTYVEDSYDSSLSIREINCSQIMELEHVILPNKSCYPESIKYLTVQNIKLSYSEDAFKYGYKYNLTNGKDELRKATVCYLGTVLPNQVNSVYDELQKLFEEGTDGKSRVVVFYKLGQEIKSQSDGNAGSIIYPANDNSSIL